MYTEISMLISFITVGLLFAIINKLEKENKRLNKEINASHNIINIFIEHLGYKKVVYHEIIVWYVDPDTFEAKGISIRIEDIDLDIHFPTQQKAEDNYLDKINQMRLNKKGVRDCNNFMRS